MSNVNQKYLKDESGNIFSPITSIGSVYKGSHSVNPESAKELYNGIGMFGNRVMIIPSEIKRIDVYTTLEKINRVIVSVDTSTPSQNQVTGQLCALSGYTWVELEFIYRPDRSFIADYCGYYTSLTGSVTNKTNNSDFYVYKIIGYYD